MHSHRKASAYNVEFGIAINNHKQQSIIHCSNKFIHKTVTHTNDRAKYLFSIENSLAPGEYSLTLFLRTNNIIQDWLKEIIAFSILDGNPYSYDNTKEISSIFFPKYTIEIHD